MSQVQAQLLGVTFEMLSGGPTQTHVGTGGGGSSSDMPWGEKKNDGNTTTSRRNGDNWSHTNKKTNFLQMGIVDFRSFLRESANPFINSCSEFDNSNLKQ